MSTVSQLNELVGQDSLYRKQKDETKLLVNKWQKSGLLEGISSDFEKHGLSVLLENQARQLISEATATGTAAIGGGGSQEAWTGVALPLVRKIFGEIASKEFVSVQPMSLPSGLVFYLDFKYVSTQPGFTNDSSVYGNTSSSDATFNAATNNGLYGAGRFGYSINETNFSATSSLLTIAAATWADINYDMNLSSSLAGLKTVTLALSNLSTPDLLGARAFKISGSTAAKIQAYYPAYTKTTSNDTNLFFVVSGSLSAVTDTVNIEYHKAPTATTRGDFEDTSPTEPATDIGIPEINVEMRSLPIVAKTRKLKAVWTPEFAQDLNAFHSIDAEAELTSMLSEYISMEIDLEILDMLIQNALTTEYWSSAIGEAYNGASGAFEFNSNTNAAAAFNQGQWFQTLITKIQKVSNKIHQRTMRGGANFVVCSPEVATILESIPGYAADTDGDKVNFAMGVQKMGAINNRFTVYKNPYMLENVILVGFRGTQFLETGAVYAPYVPLVMTPLIYDPSNFTPRKGVLTRYAKKMVRPEFYGKVVCKLSQL